MGAQRRASIARANREGVCRKGRKKDFTRGVMFRRHARFVRWWFSLCGTAPGWNGGGVRNGCWTWWLMGKRASRWWFYNTISQLDSRSNLLLVSLASVVRTALCPTDDDGSVDYRTHYCTGCGPPQSLDGRVLGFWCMTTGVVVMLSIVRPFGFESSGQLGVMVGI